MQYWQVAYLGFLVLWVLVTIAALLSGLVVFGAVSGVICALLLAFFLKRQSRIRFGAATLKVSKYRERCCCCGARWLLTFESRLLRA